MSQRYQYYFLQPVTEEELNEGFAGLENADRAMMTDQGLVGIFSGGAVAQHSPTANLTVDVGCPVIGYDDFGQRIFVPGSLANVNVAQDSASVSTGVAGSGNEKWVSVALQFTRSLSDPREDGNSNTIYFNEAESFIWIITQGAEAAVGTAPRPSIDPDNLLLCDVNLRFGTTQVLNAAIDTTRRQDTFLIAGTPVSIRAGTNYGAVQAMLDALNTHILSTGNAHPASAIGVSGLSAWADGTLNSGFTDLYDFLETGLITALAGTSGGGGTAKIAGAALNNFLDGQNVAAGTLLAQLNGLIAALSSSTSGHDGARRIYYNPGSSTTPLTATSVGAALDQIDANNAAFIQTLSRQLAASGETYIGGSLIVGTGLTIAQGTLFARLTSIANQAAPIDSPSFTGDMSFTGGPFTRLIRSAPEVIYVGTAPTMTKVFGAAGGCYWMNIVNGGGGYIGFELDAPDGVQVTAISQKILPASGHAAFPGGAPTMPTLAIWKTDINGVQTQVGSTTTDTSATAGAYETAHTLTVTTTFTVDYSTYSYYVVCTTESGGNFQPFGKVYRPSVTWSGVGNPIF